MKTTELLKNIKGIFVPPKKRYYLGEIVHGTPYFYPMKFNGNILSFRKLEKNSEEEIEKIIKERHWQKESYIRKNNKFKNIPMVRRSKDWVFKLFNSYYWLQVGWPIIISSNELGWKDKWNRPRFEWSPAFYIFFFKWQFCVWWTAPDYNNDRYYETILQYLYYQDKDIVKTKKNWNWKDSEGKSTWCEEYLIK